MVSSKVYPGLERKPGGPDNWVEKAGGLPDFISRVAKHLHYEQKMTISHAIAAAVSQCKKWCAKGNAQACKAIAEWEKKKSQSRIKATDIRGRKLTDLEFAEILVSGSNTDDTSAMEFVNAANRNSGASGSGRAFDETKYARNPLSGQFGQKFSASQLLAARRTVEADLSNLQPGQTMKLPGGLGWVKRQADGTYMIQGGAGVRVFATELTQAIQASAQIIAGKLSELGGQKDVHSLRGGFTKKVG